MSENDFKFSVITMNDKREQIPDSHLNIVFCGSKFSLLKKMKFLIYSIAHIIKAKPDILICGHIHFSPICFLAKKIFKTRYIIITHGVEAWNIHSSLEKMALCYADTIISVSSFTKNRIGEQIPQTRNKTVILPNSVSGKMFYPKPKSQQLIAKHGLKKERIILTVARLDASEKYKNHDKIIMSLPYVLKKMPNLKYLIVGKGDDTERIKSLVHSLALDDYVLLTGGVPHDELIDYYNLADIFVMPSTGEGFGIVFIEALACGKPVIAGNQGGAIDALLGGKLGLLIDTGDIKTISKAILRVLEKEVDPLLLNSDYLQKTVLEHYGADRFNKKTKEILNRVA